MVLPPDFLRYQIHLKKSQDKENFYPCCDGLHDGDQTVNFGEWTATQKAGDHGAYMFTGSGAEYGFTFDKANSRFMVAFW